MEPVLEGRTLYFDGRILMFIGSDLRALEFIFGVGNPRIPLVASRTCFASGSGLHLRLKVFDYYCVDEMLFGPCYDWKATVPWLELYELRSFRLERKRPRSCNHKS